MKSWLKGVFSKNEEKKVVENVEKTEKEQVEEAKEVLYEKHNVISVKDGFLSEIKQDQEDFMNGLLGKDQK